MLVVHVYVHVKLEYVELFKQATLANVRESIKEPGVARFDFAQRQDDPTRFVFVEAYRTAEAPAAHKETKHYQTWRDAVGGYALTGLKRAEGWTMLSSHPSRCFNIIKLC